MEERISSLERKIAQTIQLCQSLRADNRRLQNNLQRSELEQKLLTERMLQAQNEIKQILGRLPSQTHDKL